MLRSVTAVLLAVSLLTLPRSPSAGGMTRAFPTTAFVLLTNGKLLKMALPSGRVLARGAVSPTFTTPGHYLAFGQGGSSVYAVRPDGSVVRFSASTLRRSSFAGPRGGETDGSRFVARGIAVGRRSGRVYRFGNFVLPKVIGVAGDPPVNAQRAVVDVLDPDGRQGPTWQWGNDRYDWRVYRGALSPDEMRLYVSYHGTSTTGADAFDVHGNRLACPQQPRPNEGCLAVHGNVEPLRNGVIGSTGEGPLRKFDTNGDLVRVYTVGLPGNHLMEFALSPDSRWAYALGSCLYSGGLSIIDLARARTRIAHRAGLRSPRAVCGERIAVGKRYAVAIGSDTVRVFDAKNGRVVRTVALTALPLDVVVR